MGRQNRIDLLRCNDSILVDETQKAQAIFNHFDGILGNYEARSISLDFSTLQLPQRDLLGLDLCFSEEKIWAAIHNLSREKALGPNGFTGLFYQTTWPIIKEDVMRAFHSFWSLDYHNFYLVNQTFMIMLCKKKAADNIRDFRPISLIHSFNKLLIKVPALCLAFHMNNLVSPN
jgi:hypothetical protein